MLAGGRYRRMLEANPHLDADDLVQEFANGLLDGGRGAPALHELVVEIDVDPSFDVDDELHSICLDYLRTVHETRTLLGRVRRSLVDAVGRRDAGPSGLVRADGEIRRDPPGAAWCDSPPASAADMDRVVASWQVDTSVAHTMADGSGSRGSSWFREGRDGEPTIGAALVSLLDTVGRPVLLDELAAAITRRLAHDGRDPHLQIASLSARWDDPAQVIADRDTFQRLADGLGAIDRFVLATLDEPAAGVWRDLQDRFGCSHSPSWLDRRRRHLRQLAAQRLRAASPDSEDQDDFDG